MDREDIERLANNPNFIPGIYNYCDRWCQRCPFTSRCMTFAMSEEHFGDCETEDINNQAFWDKLSEVFKVTLEMVKETAVQQGIDLDSLDLEATKEEERKLRETVSNYECCRTSWRYSEMVKEWFDSAGDLFGEKADELYMKAELELHGSDVEAEAALLKDAVDVIRWYRHQIHVKLRRAISGNLRNVGSDLDYFPSDADGSAKVALLGIDRSIAAWGQLRLNLPQHRDDILDILVHLDRLRRNTESKFPNARAFVRPGFDDLDNTKTS